MDSTSAGSAVPAGDAAPPDSVVSRRAVSRRAVSRRGVLGMAALGAAGLAGACDSSSSGSTVGGKARVRLWTWYTQQRSQWPQLIKEFEDSHPTITVQNRLFGDPDSYLPALESTVSSGDVPEIFAPHVLAIQYGRSGVAADLRAGLGATFLDAFYPSTNEEYTDDGKQYGLGWMAQTFGIFYDPRILSRAGTDVPQTWDDLIEVAGKVTALGKQPCLLSNNPGTNGLDFFLPLVTQASDNRQLLLDIDRQQHGKTWNDPHVVAALRKLDGLLSAGAFAPNANGITSDQAESALYTGKAAMLYMGSWVPQDLAQSAPKDFLDHYQVMPTPAWAPGKRHWCSNQAGAGLSVGATSKNRDAALEFIRFIYQPDRYARVMNQSNSMPSTSAAGARVSNPITKTMTSWLERGDGAPHILFGDGSSGSASNAVAALIGGKSTPEETAAAIQSGVEKARGR